MLTSRFGITRTQAFLCALLWVLVWLIAGCNTVASVVGPEASRFVGGYCALASPVEREVLRASVNAQIAPHRIEVTCAGDEVRL